MTDEQWGSLFSDLGISKDTKKQKLIKKHFRDSRLNKADKERILKILNIRIDNLGNAKLDDGFGDADSLVFENIMGKEVKEVKSIIRKLENL